MEEAALALWGHVEGAAAAEVPARLLGRREAKIGEDDLGTLGVAENVLGLEVAMVDSEAVAVLDGVDDLEEDVLDEGVVPEVPRLFRDLAEEVAVGAEGEDDVDAGRGLDDVVEGDDVGVGGGEGVEGDLPALEGPLAGVEPGLVEALYRVVPPVPREGFIDDAVRSESDDGDEFECTVVYPLPREVLVELLLRRLLGRAAGHLARWR